MKRREQIVETAKKMFNEHGLSAVSLKGISKEMGIAYGNVTYHFPKKSNLLNQLVEDMNAAHLAVSAQFETSGNLLQDIILAPLQTFDISYEYRFLFIDYIEILRTFPEIGQEQKARNEQRKQAFLPMFEALKAQSLFRQDLDQDQVKHLLQLSGEVRTFFFANQLLEEAKPIDELKQAYLQRVNQLLLPYLTATGVAIYNEHLSS